MLPQHIREEGGYHLKGKTDAEKQFLLDEAKAVEEAGAFAVVLELFRSGGAGGNPRAILIPTIRIRSGSPSHGPNFVLSYLGGYSPCVVPKHVQPPAKVRE